MRTTARAEGQLSLHRNAKLGLAGRLALVTRARGRPAAEVGAARVRVSPATAHRWEQAGSGERETSALLLDRSSRPRRSPPRLSTGAEEPLLRARRETGYRPARLAWIVGRACSTFWKVLRRHGRPRLARPGALLHVDVKPLARFREPGHRATGSWRPRAPEPTCAPGRARASGRAPS